MASGRQTKSHLFREEAGLLDELDVAETPHRCSECEQKSVILCLVHEHTFCGHIDVEEMFESGDGLSCTHCGGIKDTKSVRDVGVIFRCNNCNQVFDIPPASAPVDSHNS